MLRLEHNKHWQANRQTGESVLCNTLGYGEISQYDSRCASCWLGHDHTWQKHDDSIKRHVMAQSQTK